MRLLRWLLCLYPRAFRARFAGEMIAMLSETMAEAAQGSRGGYAWSCARESAGIGRGVAREWLAAGLHGLHGQGHWVTALAVAMALQCAVYAALVPIGPQADASTGAGLYQWAAVFAGAAAAAQAVRHWRFAALILAGGLAFAQDAALGEIEKTYETTFAAMRGAKTKLDIEKMVDAIDAPEWQGHLPSGAILTRPEAISSLAGLLAIPTESRPVPRLRWLHRSATSWSVTMVYWVYRQTGDEVIGSLARDTWARTPRGWRRIRHEKFFPERPLALTGLP